MNIENNQTELIKKAGLFLLYLVFATYTLTYTAAATDLWGYLAFGKLFWESDTFPYQDVFAFLPTYDQWIYHEWLTGVLFFPLYQKFGPAPLQLLKYCMGLATMGLLFMTALRRGADFYSAIWVLFLVSGILDFGYSPVRAQIFTFFFFALSLYVLETARLTKRWNLLWCLIPMQMLWCNLHGGFLVGLGLIGFYIIGEALARKQFTPYAVVLAISSLATLINPYGIEYWGFFVRSLPMPRPELVEWLSVYAAYKYGLVNNFSFAYIIFTIIFLLLLLLWRKPRDLTACIGLGLTMFLGLKQQRHICFFLLLAGAYMPVWLAAFLDKMKSEAIMQRVLSRVGWRTAALISMFAACVMITKIISKNPLDLTLPAQPAHNKPHSVYYPLGAIDHIKQHALSGNIVPVFSWGEYLIWALYPQCRISLDGRYEQVYPESITREYFDFIFCRQNWREFLNKYAFDMILIEKESKLCAALKMDPGWNQIYHDAGAALFLRKRE